MNIEKLKQATVKLREEILHLHAQDPAAAKLGMALENLMVLAEQGDITTPLEWRDIPGNYLFTEEGLQQYVALERAYARFCIELIGGETPTLRRLKEEMGEIKPNEGNDL